MNTPDKIFIPIVKNVLSKQNRLYQEWKERPFQIAEDNIEYIRKDALLEWAEKEIEKDEYILTLDMLIDKLNSM